MTSTKPSPTFRVFTGSPTSAPAITTQPHRAPTATEALVAISHCGICGTDLHYAHAPMGLGHEVIGTITALGAETSNVSNLRVGDRVGLGYMQKVCLHCEECLAGEPARCKTAVAFGSEGSDFRQGGIGQEGCWDVRALFKIPDGVASDDAGPLMCGGATVWGPLFEEGMKAGERVGVVGVGGLGHLALQFGSKMGYEMVAFSGTDAKKEDSLKFGAAEFHATKDVSKFEGVEPIHHLLITTNVLPDFNLYAPILKTNAKIFPLTISFDPMSVPIIPLITKALRVTGSGGARFWSMPAMLNFAAKHGIKPETEKFDFTDEGVSDAIQKLKDGKMRYRGVVVVA